MLRSSLVILFIDVVDHNVRRLCLCIAFEAAITHHSKKNKQSLPGTKNMRLAEWISLIFDQPTYLACIIAWQLAYSVQDACLNNVRSNVGKNFSYFIRLIGCAVHNVVEFSFLLYFEYLSIALQSIPPSPLSASLLPCVSISFVAINVIHTKHVRQNLKPQLKL